MVIFLKESLLSNAYAGILLTEYLQVIFKPLKTVINILQFLYIEYDPVILK